MDGELAMVESGCLLDLHLDQQAMLMSALTGMFSTQAVATIMFIRVVFCAELSGANT